MTLGDETSLSIKNHFVELNSLKQNFFDIIFMGSVIIVFAAILDSIDIDF